MKHDNAKYNDREIRQIGMTAEHISQPDKVLFLPTRNFLRAIAHCTHWQAAHTAAQSKACQRVHIKPFICQ
ncbi:MAG: hypothetical protein KDE33_08890 [Bacteroidetes bacterium]|nr:hypothetical protein [Bacteroidota bacterium]